LSSIEMDDVLTMRFGSKIHDIVTVSPRIAISPILRAVPPCAFNDARERPRDGSGVSPCRLERIRPDVCRPSWLTHGGPKGPHYLIRRQAPCKRAAGLRRHCRSAASSR
jgi:hypothetical protein